MTGSVSTAASTDIVESGTGNESCTAIEKKNGTRRDETIGAEAPTVAVVRALRGSTRNTGETTIHATSSGAMVIVVTVEGAKRVCLLAGAVKHGKRAALCRRGNRRLPKGVSLLQRRRTLDGTPMHQDLSFCHASEANL